MASFFNKTILLVPHPHLPGGVSNYYKVAEKYFSENIRYVHFNSKYTKGVLKTFLNIWIILKVFFIIAFCFPNRIVVNPSLGKTAILRDGLFLLWSHLLLKKTIVFWRGWNPENENVFNQKIFQLLFKYTYLKSNKHLVLNSYIKNKLTELGVKIHAIYLTNTIVDDSLIKHNYDIKKEDVFVILFLTRIEKYKGIYETLEIFESLNKKGLNIELHIAGDGKEMNKIKEIVSQKKLDKIKFLGYLNGKDKIKAFKSAHVYLFPSYNEGMPNSVLEAMGSGLPVVCTNVGALGDFFENEKMGYLHSLPINIYSFEASLFKIYSSQSLQNEMSNYNTEYAKEHFVASKSIQKLEVLINE